MERKKYSHNYIAKCNDLNKKGSLENKKIVELHLIKYKKCKVQLEHFDVMHLVNKKIASKKEDLINYIQYIDAILKNLTEVSQQIIINEYLNEEKNENWWNGIYSRSTFFKLKQMAYSEFVIYVS